MQYSSYQIRACKLSEEGRGRTDYFWWYAESLDDNQRREKESVQMECPVGTLVLAVENEAERQALLSDVALTSLQGLFTAVPDPRSRHGQRYPLAFLLTCLVAALLCTCNSLAATGQWCRLRQEVLARVFGQRRHLTPTGALYRWLLPLLAAEHVEAVLVACQHAILALPVVRSAVVETALRRVG